MRAALQLALEHEALERARAARGGSVPPRPPPRHPARAAQPLREVDAPGDYDRLLKALSVIYGIEIYVVLKDIWGASDREVEAIARWMLEALVESSLREAAATPPRRRR